MHMLQNPSSEPAALTSSHRNLLAMVGFKIHTTIALVLVCSAFLEVNSERVLVICALSPPSHKNVFQGIYSGLAEKGHEITVVASGKPANPPQKNVKEILVFDNYDFLPKFSPLELRRLGLFDILGFDFGYIDRYCDQLYESPDIKRIMTEKFDVVLHDVLGHPCLYGIVLKLQAPYIAVSTSVAADSFTRPFGNRLPPSFVPAILLPYTDDMTFFQRTLNLLAGVLADKFFNMLGPQAEKVYRKHLGEDMLGLDEFKANASLLFVNSDLSFDYPKPAMPDVIQIGGAHCRPGKSLPPDLDEFLSGAKDGLILFSLGSMVRAHELPEETRKVFINAFAKLKQRVLWKMPLPMNDLPPNVMLSSWVPQQDVLAHPNTKLFITHGGLLSTQEAIYHSVPMIYLPIIGDQDINAQWAELKGMGKNLEILDLTSDQLVDAVHVVLGDKRYGEKMSELSNIYRDQPETPKERAVFWTEYVMRHKGAHHLRSAARKLNVFQYFSLDSIAFIGAVLMLVLWVLKVVIVKTFRAICGRPKVSANKKGN